MIPQSLEYLLLGAAVAGALKPLGELLGKLFRWIFRGRDFIKDQQNQGDSLEQLRCDMESRISGLSENHKKAIRDIKEEQSLIMLGNLACLKGLKEQGCDGPVHEAIERIEKYLNRKAHE